MIHSSCTKSVYITDSGISYAKGIAEKVRHIRLELTENLGSTSKNVYIFQNQEEQVSRANIPLRPPQSYCNGPYPDRAIHSNDYSMSKARRSPSGFNHLK